MIGVVRRMEWIYFVLGNHLFLNLCHDSFVNRALDVYLLSGKGSELDPFPSFLSFKLFVLPDPLELLVYRRHCASVHVP